MLPENVLSELFTSAKEALETSRSVGLNQAMFHRVSPQFIFDEEDVTSAVEYFRERNVPANGVSLRYDRAVTVVDNILIFGRTPEDVQEFIASLHSGAATGVKNVEICTFV